MIQVAYGYGLFTGGLGIHYGAELMGCTVIPASGGNTPRQVMLLQDLGARGLACTPSYALNLAGYLEEHDVALDSIKLEIGIFGAEPWSEEMRTALEKSLDIAALDIYGLSEIIGPGVSMECAGARHGLHVWEDHFLVEVLDPASGEPLGEGEEGEVVLTTLSKEAFPVLRYRTGDLSSWTTEPCACGRTHGRMGRIKGRTDDMLVIRGVNVFPSEIERVLVGQAHLSPHYQIVVDRRGGIPKLEVDVEVDEESGRHFFADPAGGAHELTSLRHHIEQALQSALGLHVGVVLRPPRDLPRSEGKAIRVVERQ